MTVLNADPGLLPIPMRTWTWASEWPIVRAISPLLSGHLGVGQYDGFFGVFFKLVDLDLGVEENLGELTEYESWKQCPWSHRGTSRVCPH